ncbi:MAG: hypothetical protein OEU40_16110, partial [Gammaproteobacteria bacterium]|nr:hypothetical protein [Gammaproteobacteria bacterium]
MQTAEILNARLEATEHQLDELTAKVARNEEKMRRTEQRELRLLQAEDLEALLREMLGGLRASYALQQVGVVLCDPDHDIRHL